MSLYTFTIDTEKLGGGTATEESLSGFIGKKAGELDEVIAGIFSEIEGLYEYWSGEAYTAFKENCESYRGALEGIVAMLYAFQKMFSERAVDAEDNLSVSIATALKGEE